MKLTFLIVSGGRVKMTPQSYSTLKVESVFIQRLNHMIS